MDGGFYEGGENSCSGDCKPRDDQYDFDDGLSVWGGMKFSIIKPLLTFGRVENYQKAAQNNILIKQQDVTLQRDEVGLQVVKAYYGYLTARDSRFYSKVRAGAWWRRLTWLMNGLKAALARLLYRTGMRWNRAWSAR